MLLKRSIAVSPDGVKLSGMRMLRWLAFAIAALGGLGCSGTPLVADSAAPGAAGAKGQADGGSDGPEGGAMSGLNQPCSVDSDCGSPFLACVPKTGVMSGSVIVTLRFCTPRYQLPCNVDTDCGPDGFTCNHNPSGATPCPGADSGTTACGTCDDQGGLCSSEAECPAGWSCYSACWCNGQPASAMGCYPPFVPWFSCPLCVTGIIDVDAGN